ARIRGYYIGENKLITLMMKMNADVVCMTMPDLDNFHIKRSYVRDDVEYIFLQHGMGSNNLGCRRGCTDHFDTIFLAGVHQREEEEQIGALYRLKERTLVDVGYPLIDDMRREYNQAEHKPNSRKKILIAPSWQKDNIIDKCLEEILDGLAGKGYEIIVRPHPQEVRLKQDYMNTLKTKYEPLGIEIQTDFTSNSPVLEADILITDWSGISWEYAFTTLRPILFINTPMKVMNPEYKRIETVPLNIRLRDKLGKSLELNELDRVGEVADYLLNHSGEYRVRIDELAHEFIYNLDGSARIGGEYIVSTIQKKIMDRKAKEEHEKSH
ncbi:MAG: CDP-glycerol glycerophosphotransferase family protein, partial [Lachnospiraceae bacterium]|nr:CDP-glycerol glycerophosphotransferase family protein [Lachnospiraceae bacterium]